MPQVNLNINGRDFSVACGDGEETHLAELGRLVSEKVTELSAAVGQVGDSKLLLMACLLTADELSEVKRQNEKLQAAAMAVPKPAVAPSTDDDVIAAGLESIAERIETITERLEHNQGHIT